MCLSKMPGEKGLCSGSWGTELLRMSRANIKKTYLPFFPPWLMTLLKSQEIRGRHMPPVLASDVQLTGEEPSPCLRVAFPLPPSREPSGLAFATMKAKLCVPVLFSKWKSDFLLALSAKCCLYMCSNRF